MSRWQWKWYSPCFWFSKSKKQEKPATVCVVRETTKMSLLFSNPPPMHIWRSNIRKNTDFLVLKWDNMMKNHRIYCYTSELNSDQMFLEVRESTISNRSYIKNHVPIWFHIIPDVWMYSQKTFRSCVCAKSVRLRLTLCDAISVVLQAPLATGSILEWVVLPSSRRCHWPRDLTPVSCIGRQILYH